MRFAIAVLATCCSLPALAQDLALFAAAVQTDSPRDTSPGWSISYRRDITLNTFASALYLNEGHFPGHHRDGMAALIGVQTSRESDLSFHAGLGPYHHFDTALAESPSGYSDAHGWAALYSVGASWHPRGARWSGEIRVDRIDSRRGIDTTMVLVGIGHRLDQDGSFASNESSRGKGGRDEVAAYIGQTIVNSFESENSTARSVEYRHSFGPVLRGSVAWINEGDARLIRRNGIVAQAWLEPTFADGRASLGIGYGAYLAVDAYRPEQRHNLGLLSLTTSYRLSPSWAMRLTWHRSVTHYDRDSDILLAGLGYRF